NNLLLLITVLTSVFEAIMLPVLISLVWLLLYKIKNQINSSDFRLCMEATYGSIISVFLNLFPRYKRMTKSVIVIVFLLIMAIILGKNVPNVMLSKIIEVHNFTTISSSNIALFNNNSNCEYTSCTFALD